MKLLVANIMLTSSLLAFNDAQDRVLKIAKNMGTQHGLSYTLMAIVWKESSCGLHRANYISGCYGVGHIRLRTYMDRHHIPYTFENQQEAMRLLSNVDTVNLREALVELKYWKKIHKGNTTRAIASYFAGTKWWLGIEYAKDIKKKRNQLKRKGY